MKYSVNLVTGQVTMSRESLRQLIYRVGTDKDKLEKEDYEKTHNKDGSIKRYKPVY